MGPAIYDKEQPGDRHALRHARLVIEELLTNQEPFYSFSMATPGPRFAPGSA